MRVSSCASPWSRSNRESLFPWLNPSPMQNYLTQRRKARKDDMLNLAPLRLCVSYSVLRNLQTAAAQALWSKAVDKRTSDLRDNTVRHRFHARSHRKEHTHRKDGNRLVVGRSFHNLVGSQIDNRHTIDI